MEYDVKEYDVKEYDAKEYDAKEYDVKEYEMTEIPLGVVDLYDYSECSNCWRLYYWVYNNASEYPPSVCVCGGVLFWNCHECIDETEVI